MPSCKDTDLLRFAGMGVLLGLVGYQALRLLKRPPKQIKVEEEEGNSPSPSARRECLNKLDATLTQID